MYTDEFIIRIDQLCGGGAACSEDSLCLVHDEDIIIAFKAFFCIADIFKIIDSIFLAVHIVGEISLAHQLMNAVIDHFGGRL